MAQYLKDDIQRRIAEAALAIFARDGFQGATMAAIAAAAGISTGNVYRYYPGKEVLFHGVIPRQFVARLSRLMRRRVRALDGVADVRALPPGSTFHLVSEELLAFAIENRLRVVVLLTRSEGTTYQRFGATMAAGLHRLAVAHFRVLEPRLIVTDTLRFNLEQIYANFVRTIAGILSRFDDAARIRRAVEQFSSYHMTGMSSLFGTGIGGQGPGIGS